MKNKILIVILLAMSFLCSIRLTSAYFDNTYSSNKSKFKTENYSIQINLNGGTISNNNLVITKNKVTLPTPTRTGYTFNGYSNQNKTITDLNANVNEINNTLITAEWNVNSYTVDVNPIIDGTAYNSGLSGYTFDVWVNDKLVADDVIDWYQSVEYGSRIRVKTNGLTGRSTSFDQTTTVGTSNVSISPTWTVNTYESHFYLDGVHRLTTYNKYGNYISTPNTSAQALGYDPSFYYLSGFTPWTTWYQPEYAVGFTINISEYNCSASFGSAGTSNAQSQNNKLISAGYNFCYVNGGLIECHGNYSKVMNLYNNAWNILPRSGSGYSIYKQISCDSGWSTYQRR